jgi:hypothetical protein
MRRWTVVDWWAFAMCVLTTLYLAGQVMRFIIG